jgi:hypothetical protein
MMLVSLTYSRVLLLSPYNEDKDKTAKAIVYVSRIDNVSLPLAYFGGVVCDITVANIQDKSSYKDPVNNPCFER